MGQDNRGRTSLVRNIGQDSYNRKDRTAGARQPRQGSNGGTSRTARTRQLEQENQDKTTVARQL